jgi:hypothetical protein
MEIKGAFVLAAGIVIASLIVTFARPQASRYQIVGASDHAYVLDTATGQVWEQFVPTGGVGTTDGGFKSRK